MTRERLIAAAAAELNEHGFHGTDTNAIARRAGFAPATFYKHFADKRAVFLEVYAGWVDNVLRRTGDWLESDQPAEAVAAGIVGALIAEHTEWQRFRASLRVLVAADPEVRAFFHEQRRGQLRRFAEASVRRGRPVDAIADAELMFLLERGCDALATGEIDALGLARDAFTATLVARVVDRLVGRQRPV